MRPIVTDGVAWFVCLSLGRSVTIVSPTKTAEPIEMPSESTRVTHESTWMHIGATWRIRLISPCAATMGPYVRVKGFPW